MQPPLISTRASQGGREARNKSPPLTPPGRGRQPTRDSSRMSRSHSGNRSAKNANDTTSPGAKAQSKVVRQGTGQQREEKKTPLPKAIQRTKDGTSGREMAQPPRQVQQQTRDVSSGRETKQPSRKVQQQTRDVSIGRETKQPSRQVQQRTRDVSKQISDWTTQLKTGFRLENGHCAAVEKELNKLVTWKQDKHQTLNDMQKALDHLQKEMQTCVSAEDRQALKSEHEKLQALKLKADAKLKDLEGSLYAKLCKPLREIFCKEGSVVANHFRPNTSTIEVIPFSTTGSFMAPIAGTSVATLGGTYGTAHSISSYNQVPGAYTNVSVGNASTTSYALNTNYGSALPLATNALTPSLSGSLNTSVIGGGPTPTSGISASAYAAPVGVSGSGTSGYTAVAFGTTGTSTYGTSVPGETASAYYARVSGGQIF